MTVRLEFQNNTGTLEAEAFQSLVSGWETAIENLWNGPEGQQSTGCCTIRFDVVTRVGSGTEGFHQINVVAGPQTSRSSIGPGTGVGTWDDQDNGNVAAHETGHLLGLHDEYDYGGPDGAYRNLNPQATDPQSIMAQTWGNAGALPSHIQAIAAALALQCPVWCCLCVLCKVFRRLRTPEAPAAPRRARVPSGMGGLRMAVRSIEDILGTADSGDPDTLHDALLALQAKGAAATPALIETLSSPVTLRRWLAAATLVEVEAPAAVVALQKALEDPSTSVRIHAAHALGRMGNFVGVPRLIDALGSSEVAIGHPPELVADYANAALRRISGTSVGFDRNAAPEHRRAATERWRAWFESTKTRGGQ